MSDRFENLDMRFDGSVTDRAEFIGWVRVSVMVLTGEAMTLDLLINEIVKNIFDHANGVGSLVIKRKGDGSFEFEIKDGGEGSYNLEYCYSAQSRLAGNGINSGVGLGMIRRVAENLGIDLQIDTSRGFSYSGVYFPQKHD